MLSRGRLHFNSSGDPERLSGVTIDITERKRTEAAIAEEKQFNETLINSLPGIFYLYNSEGNIIRWNRNHERLTGFSAEELKDRNVLDWFTGDEIKKVIADDVERIFAKGSVTVEAPLTLKDGSQVPYLFTGTRLETSEGRFFMGMGIDITEQKEALLKLENALKEIQSLKDRLKEENLYLQQEIQEKIYIGDFTGESDAIQDLLQKAKRVAPTDSAVLITDETGTGKELLARAIHGMSLRRDRQMITVNCAVLPSTLIEGELFGREKGAYTGNGIHLRNASIHLRNYYLSL
jgi:PAS domain S-box-containing protein